MPKNPYDPPQVSEKLPEPEQPKTMLQKLAEGVGYSLLFIAVYIVAVVIAIYWLMSNMHMSG